MSATRRPHPVVTTAVLQRRTGERTWAATLPNGCEFTAWVPEWKTGEWTFSEGDCVAVELSTYDFSVGRIAGKA
jgi:translation initiation factor IF-1